MFHVIGGYLLIWGGGWHPKSNQQDNQQENKSYQGFQGADNQQITTNKEGKEGKEGKKVKYADYVSMTEREYCKLIQDYGEIITRNYTDV